MKYLSIDKMQCAGTKHTGVPVKTLKKLLKKAGLKVSGKKATLTRRAKKARLLNGGGPAEKSSVNAVFAKQGILPQHEQDKYRAERARGFKEINDKQAVAEATEIQDAITREKTDEIRRATPGYGYMFGGGKKSRRAVKSNH